MRMELPERAVWPLPPRPEVLPWPLDSPWPRRLRRCLAPGRGFKSCKRINQLSCDRSNYGRGLFLFIFQGDAATFVNIFAQTQSLQRSKRGLDHIGSVLRTERFAQHIFETHGFENGTNGFAGDDSCSR